jgi:hypothetical protein
MDSGAALKPVRRAADDYVDARYQLNETIRQAHAQGASLREIARACGVFSHEQVRRIVAGSP